MNDQITEKESEAKNASKALPSLGQVDPSQTSCPKCSGDLTTKGECSKCKIYVCRHCGNVQNDDNSLSWGQTIGAFFIFLAMMVFLFFISIVIMGLLGGIGSYLMYSLVQTKCCKCGKRAF